MIYTSKGAYMTFLQHLPYPKYYYFHLCLTPHNSQAEHIQPTILKINKFLVPKPALPREGRRLEIPN